MLCWTMACLLYIPKSFYPTKQEMHYTAQWRGNKLRIVGFLFTICDVSVTCER